MKWKCFIPGKPNTDWDGGYFPLTMEFSEDYPAKPPKVVVISLHACNTCSAAQCITVYSDIMTCLCSANFPRASSTPTSTRQAQFA